MIETVGVATKGRYILPPNDEELHTNFLIDCDGHFVRAKWSKVGKPKTNKQVRTHFGLAIAKVRQAMMDKGETICGMMPDKIMIHRMLLMLCGGVGPLGEAKTLSQMTSDEACLFFEKIRDWAATYFGRVGIKCVIPDPDPGWDDGERGA